jgi:hypothetical protein
LVIAIGYQSLEISFHTRAQGASPEKPHANQKVPAVSYCVFRCHALAFPQEMKVFVSSAHQRIIKLTLQVYSREIVQNVAEIETVLKPAEIHVVKCRLESMLSLANPQNPPRTAWAPIMSGEIKY